MLVSKEPATTSHQHQHGSHPLSSTSSTAPLLRRPRPPSENYILKKASSSSFPAHPHTSTSSCIGNSHRHSQLVPPPTTACSDALWTRTMACVEERSPSSFHIHPLHPKGPPFLRPGRILKAGLPILLPPLHGHPGKEGNGEAPDYYCPPQDQSQFTLNDFLIRTANHTSSSRVVPSQLRHAVISRENYLKMTSWFATNVPSQHQLNTVDIESN